MSNASCGSGNLVDDPSFIDATAADVSLRPYSAAIDHGDDVSAPVADIDGYYKIDLDAQRSFARLYRVANGVHTNIAESTETPYVRKQTFHLRVDVNSGQITVFIDGDTPFHWVILEYCRITDYDSGPGGIAGLYTWGSGDEGPVVFDNVVVMGTFGGDR